MQMSANWILLKNKTWRPVEEASRPTPRRDEQIKGDNINLCFKSVCINAWSPLRRRGQRAAAIFCGLICYSEPYGHCFNRMRETSVRWFMISLWFVSCGFCQWHRQHFSTLSPTHFLTDPGRQPAGCEFYRTKNYRYDKQEYDLASSGVLFSRRRGKHSVKQCFYPEKNTIINSQMQLM